MRLILIPEILQGGQNRIGRGFAKPAQAARLCEPGNFLKLRQILRLPFPGADPVPRSSSFSGLTLVVDMPYLLAG